MTDIGQEPQLSKVTMCCERDSQVFLGYFDVHYAAVSEKCTREKDLA
jgi:hypothetical protein